MDNDKVLFWDFDGTLGYRKDGMWGRSMIQALDETGIPHSLVEQDFRPFLSTGFPWHHPEKIHTDIVTADQWWQSILKKYAEGYLYFGYSEEQSWELAQTARRKFVQLDQWALFDDTASTLQALSDRGWKHYVISNHVPELESIIGYLGIASFFERIFNSAWVGYEKPHPEIYHLALQSVPDPEKVWMIGDNIEADYYGARRIGLKSILVRNERSEAAICCRSLSEVIDVVERRDGDEIRSI